MTDQENTAVIGDDEIITDEIEESEQGGNGGNNREVKRRRRLTPEETRILSEIYEHTQKPNSVLRNRLAQELGMSSRQIQIWFQNRRAKIKRDVNDPLGTDSTSKLYYPNDPAHPYYMQYPPGTISNTIQNGATRPMGMLNIASKPILPVTMGNVYPPKQYPIGMSPPMNSFQLPVTTMNYTAQTQSSVPLPAQGNINYGYTLRSQGIPSTKPMPIQNSFIQTTTSAQTNNIQRIIPQNTMIPMQQQPIRNTNQLATSPVPPMYTQPSSQIPIYTTAPNPAIPSYPANTTQMSPLQSMSYPGQKGQPINSRSPMYVNRMNYPTTQSSQSPPSLPQNNIYVSNVPTTAATTMVYSQSIIPATNIVNSGIPTTVSLAPNAANQINPMIMSPDNKANLNKKVPITTIVSSIPTMSTIIPNQSYPPKLASTGMPTSPIKAIINSSINSKVAAKAAAMKQENAMNQNAQNLYNMNNNIVIQQTNMNINPALTNENIQNQVATTKPSVGLEKTTPATATTTGAVTETITETTTVNANVASTVATATPATNASTVAPSATIATTTEGQASSKEKQTTNDSNEKKITNTNEPNNDSLVNNNEINADTKNIDVLSTDDVTKIDNENKLNILDSMLYNPKTKESDELLNSELDSNKDQSNKFLKDLDTLYDNNDTMKWLEDDTSWNQATQLSQFPLPDEDKKNQKENESKDLGSLTDINSNDESLNDNNNQLWLSDDIDYLLQPENFEV